VALIDDDSVLASLKGPDTPQIEFSDLPSRQRLHRIGRVDDDRDVGLGRGHPKAAPQGYECIEMAHVQNARS
jgi:hypothetical protein